MSISYYLRENHLSTEPNAMRAVVRPNRITNLDDIIERMVEMGSTVGYADILGVFELFSRVLEAMLGEGANINTPFVNYRCSIRGKFTGALDGYDRERHRIVPSATSGKRLKDYCRTKVGTIKVERQKMDPILKEYTDHTTGRVNFQCTPGSMARIVGNHLKFDPEDSAQGIFFIDADRNETKVTVIGDNFPSKLAFNNPNTLEPGEYSLVVRTGLRISGELETSISVVKNDLD